MYINTSWISLDRYYFLLYSFCLLCLLFFNIMYLSHFLICTFSASFISLNSFQFCVFIFHLFSSLYFTLFIILHLLCHHFHLFFVITVSQGLLAFTFLKILLCLLHLVCLPNVKIKVKITFYVQYMATATDSMSFQTSFNSPVLCEKLYFHSRTFSHITKGGVY